MEVFRDSLHLLLLLLRRVLLLLLVLSKQHVLGHTRTRADTNKQPKIVNGILLMCINIGITPPDLSKPKKCAVLEAWTDPFAQTAKKSLEIIGMPTH